ncbi:amine oxidase catalytic domain-containing protein [Nadsonia fulvescens var. elongata DSM 6958]|uniref:Amine oxidase n=1 Tax=Nadsonia fulvescens var. elongata DSM 6958 TaxID=857566 RepID=A0A1E3PL33_9ASCO|nr:amine oxidase catalytic domain-containing protein [Nadsonia fulvescens var. elongata DSM 6958]
MTSHPLDQLSVDEIRTKLLELAVQSKSGSHPTIDFFEANATIEGIFEAPDSKAAIKKCGLENKIHTKPKTNDPGSNNYAFPTRFVPVYNILDNVLDKKFIRIDWCATGSDEDDISEFNYGTREGNPDDLLYCVAISWQKWKFIVGFTTREGMVIHDVTYDGRNFFYRLSISEMAVLYADSRPSPHRKMSFYFGDYAGGNYVNELNLGCDSLGTIKYFNDNVIDPTGNPVTKKNVMCMHKQDDDVGWKHTNYRTGAVAVVRRRILALQTFLTVANYEATGIVSTQAINTGNTSKWGTAVSPAIDGYNNTAMIAETKTYLIDPVTNLNGNTFNLEYTPFETSGHTEWDVKKNMYISIVNESKVNPISGRNVGYKLGHLATPLLLAAEGLVHRSRTAFATPGLWITKYRHQESCAGGV